MNPELSSFAARLRESIASGFQDQNFDALALELFSLQFENNSAYKKICEARKLTPQLIEHWPQIPFVPTSAFKELELTSIPTKQCTAVFHSSGTTEQKPSRHFHNAESLAVYEASLWAGFKQNLLEKPEVRSQKLELICLTPTPDQAPHSSLVHMFEVVRQKMGATKDIFLGQVGNNGVWTLDFDAVLAVLGDSKLKTQNSKLIFGTAFSFVHLLDFVVENDLKFELPKKSCLMETGGYKNRSRTMPKSELHALITERLGVSRENIICEYGMSELSSQAYDAGTRNLK
ncbi:MAG TPA: hypothetical protein VGI63_07660, partial [Verrucomicrobiae bacterium]